MESGSLNVYQFGLWLLFAVVCWYQIQLSSSRPLILNYGKGGGVRGGKGEGEGGGVNQLAFIFPNIRDCKKTTTQKGSSFEFPGGIFLLKKGFPPQLLKLRILFLCIFRWARVCWPLFCLCRLCCFFERCMVSNPESCQYRISKLPKYPK
jgi:hypothetical protein